MNPTDRYVVLYDGVPMYTANSPVAIDAWFWGRDIKAEDGHYPYIVLDYERPVVLDNPRLPVCYDRIMRESDDDEE